MSNPMCPIMSAAMKEQTCCIESDCSWFVKIDNSIFGRCAIAQLPFSLEDFIPTVVMADTVFGIDEGDI